MIRALAQRLLWRTIDAMRHHLAVHLSVFLSFGLAHAGPLEDCLEAFEVDEAERAKVMKQVEGLSFDETMELAATPENRAKHREMVIRRLELLSRASEAGHLPSRWLLITWSRIARDLEPPIDGYMPPPSSPEWWRIIEEMAEADFRPARRPMIGRAKNCGFYPGREVMGNCSEAEAEEARKLFFEWSTKAALAGDSSSWEWLAMFYPHLIEKFESTPEDRVQAYAWTHLSEIPIYDFQHDPVSVEMSAKKRSEARERLRNDEERKAAKELAAEYERDIFPKRIQMEEGYDAMCRLDPQFATN